MKSLHDVIVDSFGNHLYQVGFPKVDGLASALTEAADLIANYTEEGIRCYPEILLTTDLDAILQPVSPKQLVPLGTQKNNQIDLRAILKSGAPHCSDGWLIYIDLKEKSESLNFGLLNAEMAETALPAREVLLGSADAPPTLYLSRRSQNVVSIESPHKPALTINLGLKKPIVAEEYAGQLAKVIASGFDEQNRMAVANFFSKLLADCFKKGHGNLVGVVAHDEAPLAAARAALTDGKILETAIDLGDPIVRAVGPSRQQDVDAQMLLTARKSLIRSMLSQDGITVFTTNGQLLAFNVFVKPPVDAAAVVGGARTRAFHAMKNLGVFEACFFKSQDGNEIFWSKQ